MLINTNKYKNLIACCLLTTFCISNTSMPVFAADIAKYNQIPTNTNIEKDANSAVWNITTTTTAKNGTIGFNNFSRFNVDAGDVVNLNLINQQNKLVNLIFDNSASQINGIVNSYKGGQIGGNILFANPHGFVIGKDGVFNVGSLTLMTPKEDTMKKLFSNGAPVDTKVDQLISFNFNNNDYYVYTNNGSKDIQLEMAPGGITINGKINSAGGIDIINGGRTITIGKDAELNANMQFNDDTTGENVIASVGPTPSFSGTFASAMNDGKGINILSQNRSDDNNYMSAIVNIEGKVHANGGDIIAQTEIYGMDSSEPDITDETTSASLINVKNGADIVGRDVSLRALSNATHGDHDLIGAKSSSWLAKIGIPVECLIDNFVHLGKMKTKATVENGANISASSQTNIFAKTDMSKFSAMTISPIFAFDLVLLDVLTEATVKSGANINSVDLNVQSVTNANVSVSTTSTSILDMISDNVLHKGTFGEWGSYAITVVDADIKNKAIIEHGANLNSGAQLNVLADMTRDFTVATKNGFPLVDKNKGAMGLAVGVANVESENEAIMNANADIAGNLIVNADYTGKLTQSVSGNSGSPGEDGAFGMGGKIVKNIIKGVSGGFFFKYGEKIDKGFEHVGGNSANRANATFGKIHIAGAVNVANDDVKNHAYIGHAANTEVPNDVDIKPTISAENVLVASTLTDHKSHVTATAASSNGITAVAGAVAVNIKDLNSDAKAYGNFTINGDPTGSSPYGLIVRSNTKVERPSMLDSLWNFLDFLGIKNYEKTQKKSVDEVNSTNVDDYLANFNLSSDMQEKIDQNTSIMSLLKVFDYLTPELGAEGFFQTFAQSTASAAAREGKTSGWAGAFGVTVADTKSNAELVGGSNVTLNGHNAVENSVLVAANTDSTTWVGTSLMSIFNIAKIKNGGFAPGTSARDGDATGGSISLLINSADTTASIGENALITTTSPEKAGDLEVKASENGQFINLAAGSSSADEAGIAGNIAVSIVPDAITKATIEQGAQINNVKNAKVDASKDDNWYDVVFSFANSKESVSFGASTLFIFDTVNSYIMGNVTALNDVIVNALYDKAFLNVSINMGIAKSPETANQGNNANNVAPANQQNDDSALLPGLLEEAMNEQGANINNLNDQVGDAQDIINQINDIGNGNVGQPDRKTYSYAGGIILNVVKDSVQAYIGDGAIVKAGKDVKVTAKSIDQNIEVGTIFSFNGNTGGGGTVGFNLNMNDIDAYIGSANVNAKKDLEVKANEDNTLYSFSAGIGQAKDSSGVGTLSLDIQKNDINASIRDGAKINTSDGYDVADQSVKVDAGFDNYLVKGVGAVSIKAGGSEEGSAKGASIDVDAAATNVNAYIKGAEINASKAIDVTAKSTTKLLDITAAGAVSTNGGAYDGSVGLYVSTGTTGAYMENTHVNESLYNVNNQQVERVNKGADVKVSAENKYDSITVVGTIAGGTKNAAGGSIRVDVINDTINSYIKNSSVNTTGNSDLINKSTLDSVAVTAAGSLSTSENAFGGAIMLIVDDTTQNSYISGSTVNTGSVGFDTDATLNTTAVTGGVTISTSGKAIGGSLYTAVLANEMNTYILDSNVTAVNDVSLATDFDTNVLSVVASGSGGSGVAASGAINTVVNNSHSNTYIKSTTDKEVKSTSGKVSVKGTDDLKFKAIVGNLNISISDIAAGASINTVVDNSNLYAGIEGTKLIANKGVEADAHATNDIMSITVGGSGGLGVAAEGSINTVVMAGDVTSKIIDSVVNTEGGVTVDAYDKTTIRGGTGSASVSVSTGALGASIVTGVINNEVISAIENSKVDAAGKVTVSSLAEESLGTKTVPFITIAGGGSAGTSLEGVIDTMVINSTSDAHIRGTKTLTENNVQKQYGVKSADDVKVSSEGKVVLYSAGGSAAGGGIGGIGATIHTVVIDKDTLSQSSDTIVDAKNISSIAKEEDDFFTTLIAASGGGTAGIAGVVNTNVITSDVKTGFSNSTLNPITGKIDIKSDTVAKMQTITGSASGGGTAGVGLSAVNDVIRYRLEAALNNVTANFDELSVNAKTDNTYEFSTVSGAGGGLAGVVGVENVNYINNEVKAFATGNLTGNKAEISAKDKVTFTKSYSGVAGGGGTAGVGAAVEVNQITSTVLSYIGGNAIKVNDIDVKAEGEQNFDHIVVVGLAGGGMGAGAGTALANVIETTVKAYVTDDTIIGETDNKANRVSLNATNTINLTEDIGALAFGFGGAGIGATVGVNKFSNTVEAYTGKNTTVNTKNLTIKAQANNNLGNAETGGSLIAVAGAGGLFFGGAGTVMYNSVKDTVNAYVGKANKINLADSGKLDIKATDVTKIYDSTGAVAGGAGGLGASVDYNVIENTVVACVKSDSEIKGNADISVVADSQELINNMAVIVSGGIGSLTGGVLYASIGKKVGNASYNNFSEKDQENFKAGENQSKELTDKAEEKTKGANNSFNNAYNDLIDRVTANKNTKDSRVRNTAKKQSSDSLFTKSEHSGVTESDTDRAGTTSAFIDSNVKIEANNLTVNAKNSDNVDLSTTGIAAGGVAIGVSIAVSDNTTTTNAFIQNNADINVNSLTLKAESTDNQHTKTLGVAVGVGGGSGSSSHIKSNKTTNAYINREAKITTLGDMLINAVSKSGNNQFYSEALGHAYGGVGVGVSVAHATSEGNTKIDIGEGVILTSDNGNITIKTDANEYAHSDAWAAVGALAGGSGAESYATVGKNTTVNIDKNFSATANNGKLNITSNAKNNAFAESNGRAYGAVSAGGTKTKATVSHTSGVRIADATESKTIKAKEVSILSKADNNTKATTYAGAGAAVGIAGSGVYGNITSNNNVYVGKNYNIETGKYSSVADSINEYVSYNKSNAFGVVSLAIPFIENTINSTVNNESYANINSDSSIILKAVNEVKKTGVDGYDLYGGSGGLATGSGGYIKDNVTLTTKTKFGGDKAYAMGNYGSGSIDISAYNIANINEKADLYSHGGIAGADMDSKVYLSANADVNVSNKNIKTKDDHISYAARNDVDIYAKSNVESYGGVAGAGGEASAIASTISANVTFEKDTHSTSGRDTNISAVSNKSLESYIYARTRGLVSALNDESNAKSQNSRAFVYINGNGDDNEAIGNAVITAFDAINITAQNTSSKIKADRDSKAYQLWCIPYTGKGNKNTQNTVSGSIELNGILKSGLGYNKSLHLNVNGEQVDENGNVVENGTYGIYANKEEIGTIKTSDMQEDIQAYERSKQNVIDAFTTYETQVNEEIEGYQEIITNNTNEKSRLEGENSNLSTQITTATNSRQADQTALNNITNANNDLAKLDGTDEEVQSFIDTYGSLGNEKLDALISARNEYYNADSEHQAEKQAAYDNAKYAWSVYYDSESLTLGDNIQGYTSDITMWSETIESNNTKIADCITAIGNNTSNITTAETDLEQKRTQNAADIARYDAKIAEIQAKIDAGQEIPVYAIYVDDVVIRSGKITFNGDSPSITHVSGNGYIHAPGQNASIKIQNDSVSNMAFNKLSISSNLEGGVSAKNAAIDSTIHFDTHSDEPAIIKVINTVDKNDPTVNIDTESNAGDMVFYANVENPNGIVDITNYTGDVIVNSGVTAKDLHIKVPNGGYEQVYTNNTQKIGGSSGTGAIIASGNITIESQTIDVNGLIKSGTEIKEVEIPEFTIKKVGDNYYQVVGTEETLLTESSTTKGYYYLKLSNDNSDLAVLRQIKAYFKPADKDATGENIAGDIYLFKADTVGGNITLTGNIINTSSTGGKIELVNGYGHINVVNNSSHNLVTNSLNADTETKGVLTINDFKVNEGSSTFISVPGSYAVPMTPDYSEFDNIKHENLTEEFLANHAGKYTIKINDDNNSFDKTSEYITDGNGSWGSGENIYNFSETGLRTYTTTYVPGSDAYYVSRAGEMVEYQRYVERSWIVELFCGEKYVTDYYYRSPEYGVAQNPIAVNFVGYDKPEINITSQGNVVMNNSISSLPGTINIQSDGNIISNSLSHSISGKNINLTAGTNGTIGEFDAAYSTVKPLQVVVYDDGLLTAYGKDVYLNYPKSGVSNIDISTSLGSNVYLATDSGSIDMKGKSLFGIQADNLELHADSININPSDMNENADYLINVQNWTAKAKDDIYIENKSSIIAKYIVSDNNGNITLISKNGSILAGATDAYSDYNIHGGNYNIFALSGNVGESDNPLKFARAGIYNVHSFGDINIDSDSKMYIDRVSSDAGSVNLKAKFGIIASDITTDKFDRLYTYKYDETSHSYTPVYSDGTEVPADNMRVYHISSADKLGLTTIAGNIENLTVDTDGVISACAGYNNADIYGTIDPEDIADATSDINITLLSKSISNANASMDEYLAGRKDMYVGRVFATQNVTLSSEGAVLKSNNGSGLISGESITINAVGDVGGASNDTALSFGSRGEVSIYTKAGSDVLIYNYSNLKINRIDVTNNVVGAAENADKYGNTKNSIRNVNIYSIGNIINAVVNKEITDTVSQNTITGIDEGTQSTVTQNVDINTQEISDAEQKYPNIRAENISLSTLAERIGDYNKELVIETTSPNGGLIYSQSGILSNSGNTKGVYIKGAGNTLYIKDGYSDNLNIVSTDTNIVASNIRAYGDAMLYSSNGNITANDIMANSFANNNTLTVSSGGNVEVTKAKASNIAVDGKNATVKGAITTDSLHAIATDHATLNGAIVSYLKNDADKTQNIATIDSYGDITLNNSTINGKASVVAEDDFRNFSDVPNNIYVYNTTINGNSYIASVGDTNISDLTVDGKFENISDNTTVTGTLDVTGDADIYSTKDVTINDAKAYNLNINSQNADISGMTIGHNAAITTSKDTKIANGTIEGTFSNTSQNTTITGSLNVTGMSNMTVAKDAVINEISTSQLTLGSENANITQLTTTGSAYITTTADTTIANGSIGNNYTNTSKNTNVTGKLDVGYGAKITTEEDITINEIETHVGGIIAKSTGDTTIQKATVNNGIFTSTSENTNINELSVEGNTTITSAADTIIGSGTINGNFTNTSDTTTVTGKLKVTGDATITSVKDVVINEIESQTLTASAVNANIITLTTGGNTNISTTKDTTITTATVGGDFTNTSDNTTIATLGVTGNASITSAGDTQIGGGTVGGNFTNSSENTQITAKLDVTKDVNIAANKDVTVSGELNSDQNVSITATNNTQIADANIKGNLDVITENLNISEMDLDGNINATVDKAVINTSNDLNVDVIKGNTTTHTDTLSIVAENIKNGTGTDGNNIYAKDVDLNTNNSIGTRNTSLNVNLPDDNTVSVEAGQLANIKTTGTEPNYKKYKAKDAIISSDEGIDIKGLEVDNFEITTKSTDVNLDGVINKGGNINTADKRVSINNENLEPDYYATTQLHNPQKTMNLQIDSSNNIKVRSKYVVRHNQGIVINGTDFLSSMESEDIKSAELSLKNSEKRKDIPKLANDSLYEIPQKSSDASVIIRTIQGEIITPDNINNIINLSDNLFYNHKKDKKKAKATIFDKISYEK